MKHLLSFAYETCSPCQGSGLQNGINGPVTCEACNGNCAVRLRDDRGRFMAPEDVRALIAEIRIRCSHDSTKHESNEVCSWDECVDCGATLNGEL